MRRMPLSSLALLTLPLLAAGACTDAAAPESDMVPQAEMQPADPADSALSESLDDQSSLRAGDLVAVGELRAVDPDASTFTIEVSDQPVEFTYDAQTAVIGVQGQTQGLAGLADGASVTVFYSQDGDVRRAVRIEAS